MLVVTTANALRQVHDSWTWPANAAVLCWGMKRSGT